MLIGGYQPCSLCDFPGHVAAVVFTQGCNFRCPFCHNGGLWQPRPTGGVTLTARDVLDRLQLRRGQLDAVVISGGEPTLHEDLPEFLVSIKAMRMLVKLDTNGSRPDMLARLLRTRLVDYVAMDVKAPWAKYDTLVGGIAPVEAMKESVRLLAASGCRHEFRTTLARPLLCDADTASIRAQLPGQAEYRIQAYRPELARSAAS